MQTQSKFLLATLVGMAAWLANPVIDDGSPRVVREAQALVGVPLSPVSYAGVARRHTRRAVALTSTAATASQQQAAQPAPPPPPAAAPAPAPAAPAGAPPVGSIVTALPSGCTTLTQGGVQYFNCAGVYYRAAFQGNNLVYVVQQP